ncbi:MAG: hypothetical protein A4S16_07155 [Proteobacteria bacterium SG_bin6]|nr:MAG: hypothetical protein A4S16_07155 [Proteobacteria bacterium SG_bin6]
MSYLLDTHTLLWWFHYPAALSPTARAVIADASRSIFVSAVSAMEIALKHRKGKLAFARTLAQGFAAEVGAEGFTPLAITVDHAQRAGAYPAAHADPWDRLLAAQAEVDGLQLISCDKQIAALGVTTLW